MVQRPAHGDEHASGEGWGLAVFGRRRGGRGVHRSVDGGPAVRRSRGVAGRTGSVHDDDTARARARWARRRDEPAVTVRGLGKRYGGARRCSTGWTSRCGAASASRCSGPTAPARRRRSRSSRACGRRDGGDVRVLGEDPARRRPRLAGPDRRGQPGRGRRPGARRCARRSTTSPATTREPRPTAELLAAVGLEESAGARVEPALRRPAPPAGRGAGRAGPAGAALPRRADHRHGPGRPPPVLGADPRPARRRDDDPAHHPLPRRGRRAGRPGRRRRRRPAGRGGAAGRARRASCAGSRPSAGWRTAPAARCAPSAPAAVLRDLLAGRTARSPASPSPAPAWRTSTSSSSAPSPPTTEGDLR